MNKSQKGFGAVELLLILIIVGMLGGIGWYVYSSNKNTDSVLNNTSNSTVSPSKSKSASSSQSTTSSKKYLEVSELGIKFELTDKLKNAYYVKTDDGYFVSVHDFDSNPNFAGCKAGVGDTGLAALITAKVGGVKGFDATWTQADLDKSGLQKVGDTYYGFQHGSAPCWDQNAATADKDGKLASDFMQDFVAQQRTIQKL
jgi:competence protein ComGC